MIGLFVILPFDRDMGSRSAGAKGCLSNKTALAMVFPVRKVAPTCTGIILLDAVSMGSLPVWYLNA